MFKGAFTRVFDKYYLTVVFTLLAITIAWSLARTPTQYLFFVLFNFVTVIFGEYLINRSCVTHTKKYNISKGVLGFAQLLLSSIVLWYIIV